MRSDASGGFPQRSGRRRWCRLGHHGGVHIHAVGVGVECGLGDAGDGEIGGVEDFTRSLAT